MSSYGMNTAVPAAAVPVSAGQAAQAERQKLEHSARSGANWFFWIAGLSLVNSIVLATGGDINFIFGLGITLLFDAVAHAEGAVAGAGAVALVINAIIAAGFVGIGLLARRQKRWAFAAGMALYALDGLIFVLAGVWLNAGAHAVALYLIYTGFAAAGRLTQTGQPMASPAQAYRPIG